LACPNISSRPPGAAGDDGLGQSAAESFQHVDQVDEEPAYTNRIHVDQSERGTSEC
jgi:hypothetical protein